MENRLIKERRKAIIAISGSPGSGKTTYARYIAEKLGFRFLSAGSVFREMAKEHGVNLVEFNKMASKDPRIDKMIEQRIIKEASRGGAVVEGHLVAWTLYDVADLLIYLNAPLGVRLERIARREGKSLDTVARETLEREYYEALRYKRLYGADISNLSFFHIVLDTSIAEEDIIKKILYGMVLEKLEHLQ